MGGGKGTLWASAAIAASKLTWEAPLPACDAEVVSLATHPIKANVFYAVAGAVSPAARAVVEYVCCLALPNLFAKYNAAPAAQARRSRSQA